MKDTITVTTINSDGETTHTINDPEAAAALTEAYEDAKAYRSDVLDDLVQRAIDNATDEQYRHIIGSMSGHLATLSIHPTGEAYEGFTRAFHLALSHIAKAVYVQAIRDGAELPNTIDGLREDIRTACETPHPYDIRYKPSSPVKD